MSSCFWTLFGGIAWGMTRADLIHDVVSLVAFALVAVLVLAMLLAVAWRPEQMIRKSVEWTMPADDNWQTQHWMG